jgi:hypothetical protein
MGPGTGTVPEAIPPVADNSPITNWSRVIPRDVVVNSIGITEVGMKAFVKVRSPVDELTVIVP